MLVKTPTSPILQHQWPNRTQSSQTREMATANQIVTATNITAVWLSLGGEQPKHGRARAFYRGGDNLHAVSLDNTKGCWFDHRDGIGGGILDLIRPCRFRHRKPKRSVPQFEDSPNPDSVASFRRRHRLVPSPGPSDPDAASASAKTADDIFALSAHGEDARASKA